MAQKRMIDKKISLSEQVADLSLKGQLLFTWMIPHADDVGLLPASPRRLKAMIVPMINEITADDIQMAVNGMSDAGLVRTITYQGEDYLLLTNFERSQVLRKDRNPQTHLPIDLKGNTKDDVTDNWRTLTDICHPEGKRREVKGSEEKRTEGKGSAEGKTNYPSQSSGSVADAQEKPRGVPEVAKLRDALHKKNPPKLGILLLLFSLLLLAKPTFAAEKIVVRYKIKLTNGHNFKPPAHTVAGGAGGRKGASTPTSPTRTASQSPSPSPRPFEMGGGGRALAGSVKDQVLSAGAKRFGEHHTASLEALVMHESGFNQYAQNGSSGACGLFQAMPCEKMGCSLDDVSCQIDWGFGYIERRYGNPTNAWDFWQSRRPINGRDVGNWY